MLRWLRRLWAEEVAPFFAHSAPVSAWHERCCGDGTCYDCPRKTPDPMCACGHPRSLHDSDDCCVRCDPGAGWECHCTGFREGIVDAAVGESEVEQ